MHPPDEQGEKLHALFNAMVEVFELVLREVRRRQPAAVPVTEAPTLPQRTAADLDENRLWSAEEVARFVGASRSWVYSQSASGRLPALRVGGLLRFDPVAIRRAASGRAAP